MTAPGPTYFIACRECPATATLPGVPDVASWYLIHAVKTHWDIIEKLRDADDATLAAAIGSAAAKGWLG